MFTIMADELMKFKEDMQEAHSKVMYMILLYHHQYSISHFRIRSAGKYESLFQYRKFEY